MKNSDKKIHKLIFQLHQKFSFASREEVSRHLQEGGVLKLSAVLKLGTGTIASGCDNQSVTGQIKSSDDPKEYYGILGSYPFSNILGDCQQNRNIADDRMKAKGAASSTSGEESDSWLPCSGFTFSSLRSAAPFRTFCVSFGQMRKEKKDDEKKKKEIDAKGSYGYFNRKKTVKGSDSDNDSDSDGAARLDSRYNIKRDGQRRPNDTNVISKNRGILDKSKQDSDHNHLISKRDSYGTTGRDTENFTGHKKDNTLFSREDDSDESPVLRKSERLMKSSAPKEMDFHERNKSYSGIERKCNERHFRTNSSMI